MSVSSTLFEEACKYIPGGVNSPVRACVSVNSTPLFIKKGQGAIIEDVDGNSYVDYVGSWGPLLLGHAHPTVTKALCEAVENGTSYGAPCEGELRLAEKIVQAFPSMDMVRMVNSGTEATMSALRLARAVTGRDKLVKCIGCYHGHADAFLAAAGSGVATLSLPGTPGVPASHVADTLLVQYNDIDALTQLFEQQGKDIAAFILEPIAGNMGLVLPQADYLERARALCDTYGALLIFDEVITGFRCEYGGAQTRFGVSPDLTTLGKIIGGGLPVGAYGGKAEYMERIAPLGDVYQAGTLSGNPLAMVAGFETLSLLEKADYADLERRVELFCQSLEGIFEKKGIAASVVRFASMFTIFFADKAPRNFAEAMQADAKRYAAFYATMREGGVNLAPSAFETAMVSFAHNATDFEKTLQAAEKA